MKIPAFYSHAHALHAPEVEFMHGRLVPYFEKPDRVSIIREALIAAGLAEFKEPKPQLTRELLTAVHDPGMLTYLEQTSRHSVDLVRQDFALYHMQLSSDANVYYYESVFSSRNASSALVRRDTSPRHDYIYDTVCPIGSGTWTAAYHSANLAFCAAQALIEGHARAYALCRPPGHHAGRSFMGGYCYLNNAALAAQALLSIGKVAVVDIDYHHGNGTQSIFWDDPRVFFASIHADPAQDYPYYAGYRDERGSEHASGTTLNVPLPHGTESHAYLEALDFVLNEVLMFQPASVVVSLGFDTYKSDPISSFRLDLDTYTEIGRRFGSLNHRVLYVQEGGYYLPELGEMAAAFFKSAIQS